MSSGEIVAIDGSMGEGGGQILRYSLALSALLLKPVKIINIRAKRSNPGLRPQHLTAVRALADVTMAEVIGASVGSQALMFKPRRRLGGSYKFNIGTAGSISLVIQALLPALLFAEDDSTIEITGGTDVSNSPPIDYMRFVFKPTLEKIGANIEIQLKKRGHYPRGGGLVVLNVRRLKEPLMALNAIERGEVRGIEGLSHCVKLPSHVAMRQAKSAEELILKETGIRPRINVEFYETTKDPHLGPGSGITIYAVTDNSIIGADALGERGKPAERVGEEAAVKLLSELRTGMAFDVHMADMLIPYIALAKGRSCIGVSNITLHALTAIMVTKQFLRRDAFNVRESNGRGVICIEGISYLPQ
ncbi:MAG: RNA 3'-terminal phosphate cyclase [Sulfolobales archaeon]|nr:RNA 3'-terminal phosphate cyclase [Sulfolobales archaeon]MCX8199678.1 RNA 3'-terminal phosphate cyclase [Sulfolobales archaeon]MDW8170632.1 RNA 3'-terminal phosphate cyclase [Desulfurococcaceae archaeon]